MAQPAYQMVANAIRDEIASRRLVEGDRLPTIRELARTHGVPVGTVARALDLLRSDGVVVSRHGKGLYVRVFRRIVRSSPGRLSKAHWGAGRAIQDHDTRGRLRSVDVVVTEVSAPDPVSDLLGVPPGTTVLSRERRFVVEDRTVQSSVSFIPLDIVAVAPAVAYTGVGNGGMYARMADAGVGPVRFVESLVCRIPTAREAAGLGLPGATPVVAITRLAYIESGRCVEVNEMVLDASAYTLEYHFAA